ncbi:MULTISPECIES: type II toxin-antitoxin system RelE/ParE family toxin [Xanthomonas]|uniref:type II toxin-antitoxin system RelE/ParE family toxin n=1 Tax=Xanthomonas TaxID=338 RepID=UPI0003616B01|nr:MULTISPECIES: type II toxin-antitoxin system RelE/ParE family toxin [Xanthomonas]QDR46411.1 type II toxin-antitoxin system RelE/ParE family toxin [Xanthomonas citri pv. glycines]AOY61968.1 addiction module protein [Xanthomonas citri pv. glycines str. 8ra]ARV24363.1 addiction module protein [Xanthomonas citri pv. glycines str. 12-2]QDS21403.1 type II toxin-antitoxin system RelE/ParE family toxin [Xanthomonas citri pv. glycines]QTK38216.1 type II toxin-antitoxin system RelE/ParE family toxin 
MPDVITTIEFDEWVRGLSIMGKAKVLARITNMERGNLGDCEPVGEGVSESRINWGPGLRLYFVERGDRFIILLGGGDKSTQQQDINAALARAPTVMS